MEARKIEKRRSFCDFNQKRKAVKNSRKATPFSSKFQNGNELDLRGLEMSKMEKGNGCEKGGERRSEKDAKPEGAIHFDLRVAKRQEKPKHQ